jgi:phosphoribosyl 1,2-cyclic phosphodiesterase
VAAERTLNPIAFTSDLFIVARVPVQFTILGSGSSGNCAYLESGETRLLIDAGLSARQIRKRLSSIGRGPETLTGIIITHEHSDHVQGLATLTEQLGTPVYCNRDTKDAIEYSSRTRLNARVFATGEAFELGEIRVETFTIPHDAQDPVGFLLRTPNGNIGVLTDLGHVTKLILERVRSANVLVLESNHDVKMLQDCPNRPWALKQRILGRHGHLSNEAAADAAAEIMSPELRYLYLGHLSGECNRPDIARRVFAQRLGEIGATHVNLEVTSQAVPSPTLTLSHRQATGTGPTEFQPMFTLTGAV